MNYPINKISLIGAGGHSLVVLDVLESIDSNLSIEFFDKEVRDFRHEVHPIDAISTVDGDFHICIGNNDRREFYYNKLQSQGANALTIMSQHAVVSKFANIAPGTFVAAGAIIASMAKVGICCIVNHNSSIDHDCEIGNFTHIAPGATITGNVKIGNNCLIGANATVLPGVTIGDNITISAGSTVVKDL